MIINSSNLAILRQAYNAAFKKGFEGFGVEGDWTKVATQETSDTSEGAYAWLGLWQKLREWTGNRHVNSLKRHGYTLVNRRFESTIAVPVDAIEDDQYGVYNRAFQNAGAAVKAWPDDLVFGGAMTNAATNLCYDGQAFLDTNHPMGSSTVSNYDSTPGTVSTLWFLLDTTKPMKPFIFQMRKKPKVTSRMMDTDPHVFDEDEFKFGIKARGEAGYGFWQQVYGSVNNLTSANFDAYIKTMATYTTDEGYKMGIKPNLLVCGVSRRVEALDLLNRQLIDSGNSNRNYKAVDLLVTPHLD